MSEEALDFEEWSESGKETPASGSITAHEPQRFRPINRPPMAILVVFDDGLNTGEVVRIRQDKTTLGRQADISIPHDPAIAAVHAEIVRSQQGTTYRWTIRDLNSQSGVLVRARKARLTDGLEFLAGSHRYRYSDAPTQATGITTLSERLAAGSLPGASLLASDIVYPSIQRITAPVSESLWLISGAYWIGRGKDCAVHVPADNLLAEEHVCISQVDRAWQISSQGVTNGFWIRMQQLHVSKTCTFQLGEQRFRLIVDF